MEKKPFRYSSYIKTPELLSLQKPVSFEVGKPAHDEMLFVVVHQAYELWFKQIIFELDSVISMFRDDFVDERNIGTAFQRLTRIVHIQKLLIQQIETLETMTPLDFLDFINLLIGASGFQSAQFRLIEAKLGLLRSERLLYNNRDVDADFTEEEKKEIKDAENSPTLFTVINSWLERTPFIKHGDYSFIESFRGATSDVIAREETLMKQVSEEERTIRAARLKEVKRLFDTVLDEKKHDELVAEKHRRLSYKATLAALFISLYRDEPILHLPFKVLETIVTMDEELSHWRYRHALMVMRMVGSKPGTGGSSGYSYLIRAMEAHKVFKDFMSLTTLFVPRSVLPKLPPAMERHLSFSFTYAGR